jgi:hypothetical protein
VEFKRSNRQKGEQKYSTQSVSTNASARSPLHTTLIGPTSSTLPPATTSQKKPIEVKQVVFTKKVLVFTTIGLVLIGITGYYVVGLFNQPATPPANLTKKSTTNSSSETPKYRTVSPKGKSVEELGGWRRVSPPKGEPVFAYTDAINNIPINVSQQPLPEAFKTGTDTQVAELAKKFNATTKIDADGTTVYIGTSAKGPQSAILAKSDVLILIKSQQKVEDASWIEYIKSLN